MEHQNRINKNKDGEKSHSMTSVQQDLDKKIIIAQTPWAKIQSGKPNQLQRINA